MIDYQFTFCPVYIPGGLKLDIRPVYDVFAAFQPSPPPPIPSKLYRCEFIGLPAAVLRMYSKKLGAKGADTIKKLNRTAIIGMKDAFGTQVHQKNSVQQVFMAASWFTVSQIVFDPIAAFRFGVYCRADGYDEKTLSANMQAAAAWLGGCEYQIELVEV